MTEPAVYTFYFFLFHLLFPVTLLSSAVCGLLCSLPGNLLPVSLMYFISPLCIVLFCLGIHLCKDRDYVVFKGCKGHVFLLCPTNRAAIDLTSSHQNYQFSIKHRKKFLLHFILQGLIVVLHTEYHVHNWISAILCAWQPLHCCWKLCVLSGGEWPSLGISRLPVCRFHCGQGSNDSRVVASHSSGRPGLPSCFVFCFSGKLWMMMRKDQILMGSDISVFYA